MNNTPTIQIAAPRLGTSNTNDEETSKLKLMKPHVPGIVTFADHNRPLPWSVTYHSVVMFADISGFTALCEKYSTMGQSGVDQLTRTLNEYLSALVEGILGSDGDILKFAGDAILAIWRVGREEELQNEIIKVTQCCLDIQDKCGEWNTDIGVKLTVKIGVSAGEMTVTYLGNQEYRHYVELGRAVTAVNNAENFCQSGMVVLSPDTWDYCDRNLFDTEVLEDGQHERVFTIKSLPRKRSSSMPTHSAVEKYLQGRRLSSERSEDSEKYSLPGDLLKSTSEKSPSKVLQVIESNVVVPVVSNATVPTASNVVIPVISIQTDNETGDSTPKPRTTSANSTTEEEKPKPLKEIMKNKMKFGGKLSKLRRIVETVTEMKLDIALRLYILSPVLKKIDDDQPLEYLSEMRQVSIVFMNLVLDEMANQQRLLQAIFEVVYTKAKAMHGSLNKVFLFDKGCTFLVIFGLPGFKHENDCAHALICSGRMKSSLDKIDGVGRVSIGVTTGTTFCGVVGHPKRHEYSVIGRKVNMAARLMMHYPDKITCDTDTFQTCRLPPMYFEVLITKRMKGLRNIGVIREFVSFAKDEKMVAKSITHSEHPILGRQVEEFMFREQVGVMRSDQNTRRHLIFSGQSGIGKTRLLDQIITIAQQKSFKVISCRVELGDNSYPYFVANHILRALLSSNGYSHKVDKEPYILDAIGENNVPYLYLLNDVIGSQLDKPVALAGVAVNETKKRRELLHKIARLCLVAESETIVVIDDAHNTDASSWEFLCELVPIKQTLIVLGMRPSIIDTPPCKETMWFIDSAEVKVTDLSNLDLKFVAPLACQLMNVVSIPRELDRILRDLSHGVPSWCTEVLKDMLDKKQLLVVLDDGRAEFKQSFIAPNTLLIKPASSLDRLGVESLTKISTVLHVDVTEIPRDPLDRSSDPGHMFLSDLGYLPEGNVIPLRELQHFSAGGAMSIGAKLNVPTTTNHVNQEVKQRQRHDRISIFAMGVSPKDIPIPPSMKELIAARIDSMRASDQLLVKCAAVLGKTVRRDILEMLLPKAHRGKLTRTIRRLIECGIFQCGKTPKSYHDAGNQKYRCFCHKDDVQTRPGELQACFEPMFTNNLLQQTAYEVLMESQRSELHAKAAHYFELSADELRSHIPYYVIGRQPGENLQDKLRKMEDEDAFTPQIAKRQKNKVTDEMYAKAAVEAKARRGRRQAVSISTDDTVPLVHRIVEKAKPMESVKHYIENLLPLYETLCFHWQCANQLKNVVQNLLEATFAAIAAKRNAKAQVFLEKLQEILEEQPTLQEKVMQAKIHRLHGKILFQAGEVSEAYTRLSQAVNILGLRQFEKATTSRFFTAKLLARFFWYWKYHATRSRPTTLLTMEQGNCLSDLYIMDKETGDATSKLTHALQQFTTFIGRTVHLHLVVNSYSAMIECCRERGWLDISNKLEVELLQRCASRNDELLSEDRKILAGIYANSCILRILDGNLKKAEVIGKAAVEISVCIHDFETIKTIIPYYFFVCVMRKEYSIIVDLLQHLKCAAQMTDNDIARAMYHTLCLEVALIGGCPPETIQDCFSKLTRYMRTCDVVATEMTMRYYVAMTAALWCARSERWSNTQIWFDYWEIYETPEVSFLSLLARANKLECMLLSLVKCKDLSNTSVAANLQSCITTDLEISKNQCRKMPVLCPRMRHLESYFCEILGFRPMSWNAIKASLLSIRKQENKHEERWIEHNIEIWQKAPSNKDYNKEWKQMIGEHHMDWKLTSRLNNEPNMFTWYLPMNSK